MVKQVNYDFSQKQVRYWKKCKTNRFNGSALTLETVLCRLKFRFDDLAVPGELPRVHALLSDTGDGWKKNNPFTWSMIHTKPASKK